MKVSEARELPDEELRARLDEVKEELFNLRFQNATGQLDNYKRLGFLKKDVARITTVLKERELGIETPLPEESDAKVRRRRRRDEATETLDEVKEDDRPRGRSRGRLEDEEEEERELGGES